MTYYFDNAATTALSERAADAYIRTASEFPANPSSIHREGQKAKAELERLRASCADLLSVAPENLYFTSGATESIAAFFSSLLWQEPSVILSTRIEHEAVSSWFPLLTKYGWKIEYLKARGGFVDAEELKNKLKSEVRAVAVMNTNNVIGAIEPIENIARTIREFEKEIKHKISFFSDSVQALGKTGLDLRTCDVDAASFSAHKINGPRGVGLLYLKTPERFRAAAPAGGQEKGKRGGTENLAGIAGFEAALREWTEERDANEEKIRECNAFLRDGISSLGYRILSPSHDTTPYILSISQNLPSEVFTRMLADKGFCVSSGSACSNNAKGKSEGILEALGISGKDARSAIRLSFSKDQRLEDAKLLMKAIEEIKNNG